MKISAFCATTNSLKYGYPVIESIKSFLPVVDELVVVDGGSTDGTIEAINAIGDKKIRIISDESTKWEDEWFYSRMSNNFNRGYEECTGDIVFKFDVDWVFNENKTKEPKYDFRKDCEQMMRNGKCVLQVSKLHHILVDRYFTKKASPFLVIRPNCKQRGFQIKWGLDLQEWGWGHIPIIYKFKENGINFGFKMAKELYDYSVADINVYDFSFMREEDVKELRYKNFLAIAKQAELKYEKAKVKSFIVTSERVRGDKDYVFDIWRAEVFGNFLKEQHEVRIDQHSQEIRQRLSRMNPEMFGYNAFGFIKEKIKYVIS